MIKQNLPQQVIVQKRGRVFLVPTAAISSLFVSASALAAEGDVVYPTLSFADIPFGVWVAATMAFALMAGMAFIGLAALMSVLKKSRGAVR